MGTEEHPTGAGISTAAGEGDRQRAEGPTRAFAALLVGAATFGVVTTIAFIIIGNAFEGSYEERLTRIEDHLTVWRVEWAVAVVAEAFAGLGLFGLGRWFGWRERGVRGVAAVLVSVAGVLAFAAGVARFVVSVRGAEHSAEPDTWVDVVTATGVVGLVVAAVILAWLSWSTLVPRWACVILVVFAAVSVLTLAPSSVYLPGLTVYAAAGLWRSTRTERDQ